MRIITVDNYEQMSALAADIIGEIVRSNPFATLGLATGSTILGTYAQLIDKYRSGELSFRNVKTVNLDEYLGLSRDNAQSYARYMACNLFDCIDVDIRNTFIPCGVAQDVARECEEYDKLLDIIPRDLQLLGLGSNGHIAFNEPGTPFDTRTRVVQLERSTIVDNSRFFAGIDETPQQAITMGIADIVSAEKLLLLASGLSKAQAVKAMLQGEVSINCPASILRTHPDAIVILDKLAASLL